MKGVYLLHDSYDNQKAKHIFCLVNSAFEGKRREKETCALASIWKLCQTQNGSIVVKFLRASEVNVTKNSNYNFFLGRCSRGKYSSIEIAIFSGCEREWENSSRNCKYFSDKFPKIYPISQKITQFYPNFPYLNSPVLLL